MIMIIV